MKLRREQRSDLRVDAARGEDGRQRLKRRIATGGRRRSLGGRGSVASAGRPEGDGGGHGIRRRGRQVADFHEIRDGREAGVMHGFEALQLIGKGAGQPAVDVERAAAHPGDRAHVLHAGIGQLANDDALAGTQRVADDPDHPDREGLWLRAVEDGPNLPRHARSDVGERHERRVRGLRGKHARQRKPHDAEQGEGYLFHPGIQRVAAR